MVPHPGISCFISPVSKEVSIHCKTDFWPKLTSSNKRTYPLEKASVNGPGTNLKLLQESSPPEPSLPIKSSIVVSLLKLNLTNFLCKISHNTCIVFVLEVPVGPSSITGILESKKFFIFWSLILASSVRTKFPLISSSFGSNFCLVKLLRLSLFIDESIIIKMI